MLRLRTGRPGQLPSPEEAAAYQYTPSERLTSTDSPVRTSSATPTRSSRSSTSLVARTGADELMITTNVLDHAERLRSYELIREAVGPDPGIPARLIEARV